MPYDGELASKVSHGDIVRNADVAAFLADCEYLKVPSDEEADAMAARFSSPPPIPETVPAENIMAIDGSWYEATMDDRLPSTKVGYVKIGCVLIRMSEYEALRVDGGRYVDPFRVARLEDQNWPLSFVVPGANVRWRGIESVRESFRAAVDRQLHDAKTRFKASDASTSLRTTIFHLAAGRTGTLATNDVSTLKLHRCPNRACEAEGVEVSDTDMVQRCTSCGIQVFASDVLRVWEEVDEYQSNASAMTRLMLAVEHLLAMHYLRYLRETSPQALSGLTFFMDGPLAVFGNPAWLHSAFLKYIYETNGQLKLANLAPVLFIGLQKTGQVADHVSLIARYLPANRILAIDDEYRYKFILSGRDPAEKGFGENTYYGQDFIFKTPSGRSFVFAIPYPCASKSDIPDFVVRKTDFGLYDGLGAAIKLITHFESDLYTNAVVPVALAHRYTAISLAPGGEVLDLLSARAFQDGPR